MRIYYFLLTSLLSNEWCMPTFSSSLKGKGVKMGYRRTGNAFNSFKNHQCIDSSNKQVLIHATAPLLRIGLSESTCSIHRHNNNYMMIQSINQSLIILHDMINEYGFCNSYLF